MRSADTTGLLASDSGSTGHNGTFYRNLFLGALVVACGLLVATIILGVQMATSEDVQASTTTGPVCQTPFVKGSNGVVATTMYLATQAGLEILKNGGNAVDAAAAVQFMLNVVQPQSTGIGGGCFIVYYHKAHDKVYTLDGREEAPERFNETAFCADPTCMYNANCDCSNGSYAFDNLKTGGQPVGVPGTLHATNRILTDFGTLTLAQVLAPAIATAKNGFPMYQDMYDRLNSNRDRMILWNATAKLFFPNFNNTPTNVGDLWKNPDLADTFELIASQGIEVFYTGTIADEIVNTVKTSVNPVTGNFGVMEKTDIGNYTSVYRNPVEFNYRQYKGYGFPPPGSGGISLAMMLNYLELFNMSGFTDDSINVEYLHRLIDSQDVTWPDRGLYIADADWVEVPIQGLTDKTYAKGRGMSLMQGLVAARNFSGGTVRAGTPSNASTGVHAAWNGVDERGTTHFSIVDKWGNVVAWTTTIEENFGSSVVVPGRGFLLNNELTDFTLTPTDSNGVPYANRAQGGKQLRRTGIKGENVTLGGKRPMSSMTPTILFQTYANQTVPYLSIGSPGGSRIIGQVLNALTYIVDANLCLGDAVAAPRVISRNQPQTEVEMPLYQQNTTVDWLNNRGFNIQPLVTNRPLGYVQVARLVPTSDVNDPNIKFEYEAMADSVRLAVASAAGY